jgi:decaprenylphospho-beta-D-ribofuranose 2-oxidase
LHSAVLSGWGHVPVAEAREIRSEDLAAVTADMPLSRGLGRSYGDSSLPAEGDHRVAGSTLGDRILGFDPDSGILRAEAGLSLREVVWLFLPRGFFTPVSPGTQYVTLGGMVAADIHGKGHHRDGCFGQHVTSLRMRVADGRIVDCSPTKERDLFRATVGGMGLTGHILEVSVRLKRIPSPWIVFESVRLPDIDSYIAALKEAAATWPQTVGFIDCAKGGRHLGRGILIKGRWAEPNEAPAEPPRPKPTRSVPFNLPSGLINGLTIKIFNTMTYWKHFARVRRGVIHPEAYFYPLDKLLNWNRAYGRRGFTQYQCMLPTTAGPDAARRFLQLLRARRASSPVCVIKDHGPESIGLLSFPCPGISIAVDFPVNDGTQALVDALNEFVIAAGGRVYLAKDAFTRQEHYRRMEPRLPEWEAIRRRWDPERRLRSRQSVRVLGDEVVAIASGSAAAAIARPAVTDGAATGGAAAAEQVVSPATRSQPA